MNKLRLMILSLFTLFLFNACKNQTEQQVDMVQKVPVSLSKLSYGYLPDYVSLTGKTIYLNKSSMVAPISGYITKVNVREGDRIEEGKIIFEMQTPEAYMMQQDDSASSKYGTISIYAPVSGRVAGLNIVNKDVFADKGAAMCIILASNDLKVQVSIPFEYNQYAKIGNKCKIVLPDNTEVLGTFSKVLAQLDEASQTVKVLASLNNNKFLPENMIVNVLLDRSKPHRVQLLPKQCLQTDALMTKFWVMKLINDSTAAQNPVTIGNQSHSQVEILAPVFATSDLFIKEGAYGLEDTVLVEKVRK